ncbi:hypothetical protein BC830DRAFT_487086 [Chytriomyces sp. MP71]|nr:hypothetical protein BC830DRAFT_487086 [Chytriomyces sp. MP71]
MEQSVSNIHKPTDRPESSAEGSLEDVHPRDTLFKAPLPETLASWLPDFIGRDDMTLDDLEDGFFLIQILSIIAPNVIDLSWYSTENALRHPNLSQHNREAFLEGSSKCVNLGLSENLKFSIRAGDLDAFVEAATLLRDWSQSSQQVLTVDLNESGALPRSDGTTEGTSPVAWDYEYEPSEVAFKSSLRWIFHFLHREANEGKLRTSDEAKRDLRQLVDALEDSSRCLPEGPVIAALTFGAVYFAACVIILPDAFTDYETLDCFIPNNKRETPYPAIFLKALQERGYLDFRASLKDTVKDMITDRTPFYESIHSKIIEHLIAANLKGFQMDAISSHLKARFPQYNPNCTPYDLEDALMMWTNHCATQLQAEYNSRPGSNESCVSDASSSSRRTIPLLLERWVNLDNFCKDFRDGRGFCAIAVFYGIGAVDAYNVHPKWRGSSAGAVSSLESGEVSTNLSFAHRVANLDIFERACREAGVCLPPWKPEDLGRSEGNISRVGSAKSNPGNGQQKDMGASAATTAFRHCLLVFMCDFFRYCSSLPKLPLLKRVMKIPRKHLKEVPLPSSKSSSRAITAVIPVAAEDGTNVAIVYPASEPMNQTSDNFSCDVSDNQLFKRIDIEALSEVQTATLSTHNVEGPAPIYETPPELFKIDVIAVPLNEVELALSNEGIVTEKISTKSIDSQVLDASGVANGSESQKAQTPLTTTDPKESDRFNMSFEKMMQLFDQAESVGVEQSSSWDNRFNQETHFVAEPESSSERSHEAITTHSVDIAESVSLEPSPATDAVLPVDFVATQPYTLPALKISAGSGKLQVKHRARKAALICVEEKRKATVNVTGDHEPLVPTQPTQPTDCADSQLPKSKHAKASKLPEICAPSKKSTKSNAKAPNEPQDPPYLPSIALSTTTSAPTRPNSQKSARSNLPQLSFPEDSASDTDACPPRFDLASHAHTDDAASESELAAATIASLQDDLHRLQFRNPLLAFDFTHAVPEEADEEDTVAPRKVSPPSFDVTKVLEGDGMSEGEDEMMSMQLVPIPVRVTSRRARSARVKEPVDVVVSDEGYADSSGYEDEETEVEQPIAAPQKLKAIQKSVNSSKCRKSVRKNVRIAAERVQFPPAAEEEATESVEEDQELVTEQHQKRKSRASTGFMTFPMPESDLELQVLQRELPTSRENEEAWERSKLKICRLKGGKRKARGMLHESKTDLAIQTCAKEEPFPTRGTVRQAARETNPAGVARATSAEQRITQDLEQSELRRNRWNSSRHELNFEQHKGHRKKKWHYLLRALHLQFRMSPALHLNT